MKYFEQYIQRGEILPYKKEAEAVKEILAFTDALCFAMFTIRDLWGESLDMRGIIITPRECEAALSSGTENTWDEGAESRQQEKESMGRELYDLFSYIMERGFSGSENEDPGGTPRIFKLCRDFHLSPAEILCLFLAAAPEWNRKYEKIYGYIQDNVAAKQPLRGFGISAWEYITGEENDGAALSADGPLFAYLLKTEQHSGRESRLSLPMALNDTVWNYLNTGFWFSGIWKEIASVSEEEEAILVSFSLLVLHKKEGNHTVKGMAGELSAAAAGLHMEKIFLACPGEEEKEESRLELACLEQFLEDDGLLTARIPDNEKKWMRSLCTQIKTRYEWDDLILEDDSRNLLRRICDQVMYKKTVKEDWGFGKKDQYGNGISALFFGPPGTGKTMAAQVMAGELHKELFKVDVSRLVSKYVGETEKQVSSLFEAAGRSGAVLFFDEADGLFAKRSEVNNSNDRYANMETGFLLQKLEEYDGISILATNYVNNIDDAFKRRIRFLVRFPFPSAGMRLLLWKQMIPETAPVEETLKLELVAERFELSGSAIRETSLQAAYLAAAGGRGIRNEDIEEALKMHFVKYGKHLADRDVEGLR